MTDGRACGHARFGDDERYGLLAQFGLLDTVEEAVIYILALFQCSRNEALADADGIMLARVDVGVSCMNLHHSGAIDDDYLTPAGESGR